MLYTEGTDSIAAVDAQHETSKSDLEIVDTDKFETANGESSPSKEVLIGGDNNPSRR